MTTILPIGEQMLEQTVAHRTKEQIRSQLHRDVMELFERSCIVPPYDTELQGTLWEYLTDALGIVDPLYELE
ncbi:hypothetical protein [Deinococcus indicus]|uniref:hypothetical protein n=1 Tax=Deinococcus indicus TaxID=223556 RepID=UPI001177A92C|nr:hypothetical protein [Deinococcus indicus]